MWVNIVSGQFTKALFRDWESLNYFFSIDRALKSLRSIRFKVKKAGSVCLLPWTQPASPGCLAIWLDLSNRHHISATVLRRQQCGSCYPRKNSTRIKNLNVKPKSTIRSIEGERFYSLRTGMTSLNMIKLRGHK